MENKKLNRQPTDTGDSTRAEPVLDAPGRLSLSSLKLSQSFIESAAVQKVITVVPVTKPNKQTFVRVHPSAEYRVVTAVIEYERAIYAVAPELRDALVDDIKVQTLFTAISKQGDLFLWPVKMPAADGRHDTWNESALRAAEVAQQQWVRVTSNMQAGCYDTFKSAATLTEPVWPEMSFEEIIKIAFQGRYIDSVDHPVVRKLRGEI